MTTIRLTPAEVVQLADFLSFGADRGAVVYFDISSVAMDVRFGVPELDAEAGRFIKMGSPA